MEVGVQECPDRFGQRVAVPRSGKLEPSASSRAQPPGHRGWFSHLALALMMFGSLKSLTAAERVYFRNGRSMTIEDHRRESGRVTLILLGRGWLEIPAQWVDRIVPVPQEPPASGALAMSSSPTVEAGTSRKAVDRIIREVTRQHGLDEKLVRSIIRAESNFDPLAVSRDGATGLMQLMPSTASAYRVKDIFDAKENVEAGVRYLKRLMEEFNQDLALVLAAYNAGPAVVRHYRGVPPFPETRGYIRRILQLYRAHRAPGVTASTEPAESD